MSKTNSRNYVFLNDLMGKSHVHPDKKNKKRKRKKEKVNLKQLKHEYNNIE